MADRDEHHELLITVPRQRIAYLTKTFEAMDHLAVVTTVDRNSGRLRLIFDPSAAPDIKNTLQEMGVDHPFLS